MNRKERRKSKVIDKQSDVQDDFLFAFDLHKKSDLARAEVLYNKILKKNPKHFNSLRHLGIIYQDKHKLDKALIYFQRA